MIKHLIFIILFIVINSLNINSQCNDELINVCYPSINNYKFLKSYPVRLKKTKKDSPPNLMKVSVPLNGGVKYRISLCDAKEFNSNVVVNVYADWGSGTKLIGTTYDPKTKKNYTAIEFDCKTTDIYFLSFYFLDGKEGCAICMLSVED